MRLSGGLSMLIALFFTAPLQADDAADFFEKNIRPALHDQCFKCHGAEKQKGGLRLDSREALLRGGDSGPAIVPGNGSGSLLIKALRHSSDDLKMPPPKEAPKFSDGVISNFETWINAGASFPAASAKADPAVHWAFQPVRKPAPPRPSAANPIDAFLKTSGTPRADSRTLIRRMTYDLTGLPPSPNDVEAFIAAISAQPTPEGQRAVVNRAIDRLLASPAYGEKWGRKWLDLARYADTAGENTDRPVHPAWRYRNYVIDAFNRDMPYDQFVREQIAGDLYAPGAPERHAELISATGFLAVARRFGHDIDKDMHLTYEDVIDTLGKSVLGLTLGCARCHNHKYDPISTRDYYALYGIFASTKFSFPGCEPNQKPHDMMPLWTSAELARKRKPFEEELAALDGAIKRLNESQAVTIKKLNDLATNATVLLAKGEFDDGGAQFFLTNAAENTVTVKAGDMLRVTILPRANHGADTTIIELNLEELNGDARKWNLAADVTEDFLSGNPHADKLGNSVTWCFIDARKGMQLLPETVRDHQEKKGLNVWRSGDNPAVFVNASNDPISVWTKLPARTLFVHPAPDGPVAVAWISPLTGTIRIFGRVADGHAGGGDGVAWTLDHIKADLRTGFGELASLTQNLREPLRKRAEIVAREPKAPVAYAVADDKPRDFPLQKRGDPEQPGDNVARRNLELFGGENVSNANTSGRLDLARWLTDPKNPLTARVMANRIWQGHFGRGLVATPSDFGSRGATPAHPELLDFLASTFIENGWSMKTMHRLIMASDAYQQSSDGSNSIMPRRRLEAEEIRDSLLELSGELDHSPGESHPFPAEDANFTQHNPFKAVYDTRKRSVYLMTQRIQRHPFLALFDGPDANASTATRGHSTTPTQSLYFLNDPFFHARAAAFAKRALAEPEPSRIAFAHRLALQRAPTTAELNQAREFLAAYRDALPDLPAENRETTAWSAYTRSLLASNELLYID